MKKNTTKLFAMLLLFAIAVAAFTSCGIVTGGEYRFGMAVIETGEGQAAAAVIIDSKDRIALVRVDGIESKKGSMSNQKSDVALAESLKSFERTLVGMDVDDLAKVTEYTDYTNAVALAIADAKDEGTFRSTVDHLAISLTVSARRGEGLEPSVVVSSEALSRAYRVAEKTVFYDPTPHDYKLGVATLKTDSGEVGAAVLIDELGRIALVRIDELDFSYGKTDSKKTQGDSYGMLSDWGSKLAEWDDQVAHLEKQIIGKDKNTLGSIEASNGKASDVDITAGCTIGISNYVVAVAAAIDNAAASNESYEATSIQISLDLYYAAVSSGSSYNISAEASAALGETSAKKSVTSAWTAPADS